MNKIKRNSRHTKISQLLKIYAWANSGDCSKSERDKDSLPMFVGGVCNPLSETVRVLLQGDGFTAEQATEIFEQYLQFGMTLPSTDEVVKCINKYVKDFNWNNRTITSEDMHKKLLFDLNIDSVIEAGGISIKENIDVVKNNFEDYLYKNGWCLDIDIDEKNQKTLMLYPL